MGLNWDLSRIENFREVCYERLTRTEAEEAGTTLEKLLSQRNFGGANWYVPGASETEQLSNAEVIERMNPLTNVLIWATMSLNLRGITEENHQEFWVRLRVLEKLRGAFLRDFDKETEAWKDRWITFAEVKAHIGLGVNVSDTSWREWIGTTLDSFRSDLMRREGLTDTRKEPWQQDLSQIAKDTHDQLSVWRTALDRYSPRSDREEEQQHDRDHSRACRMTVWMAESADVWEDIEYRLEEEEE